MKVTNKITIHLDDLREIRPVDVMQCDVHTRELEIALFAGGKKWEIPNSVTPVISYRKPDGTKGLYDTLPNGNPACRIEANVVRAVLPPSALEAPGRVDLVLIFTDDDDNQLAAFGVPVDVHRNPGVGAVASGDYFNLQKWVRDEAAKVAKVLDIHTGSEPPVNGEAIWINPDEESEGGGAVSTEAIKQAVDEYMAEHPVKETDPTVPDWAKQPNKPKYTASEVGALPADTPIPEGVSDEQIKNAVGAYFTENPPEGGGIPIPSSAQVGQTIVVKSVDETGKPTEWEAADFPEGGGTCDCIPVPWIQNYELMGTATLLEECQRWIIKQTDDGVTFEDKQYRQVMFATKMYAGVGSTAANALGYVWINNPGGGTNINGINMHHATAPRNQRFYGAIFNGKRYMRQFKTGDSAPGESLSTDNAGFVKQIVLDSASNTNLWGVNSTVEIWGCK